MKMSIFTIYDSATEAYMRPFFAQSPGQALRMFIDDVQEEGTPCNKHPEDYALFEIGIFDDSTSEIINCKPICLQRAHEISSPPLAQVN